MATTASRRYWRVPVARNEVRVGTRGTPVHTAQTSLWGKGKLVYWGKLGKTGIKQRLTLLLSNCIYLSKLLHSNATNCPLRLSRGDMAGEEDPVSETNTTAAGESQSPPPTTLRRPMPHPMGYSTAPCAHVRTHEETSHSMCSIPSCPLPRRSYPV